VQEVSDTLRRAVRNDSRTGRALARAASVPASCLNRFKNGQRPLQGPAFDRVASVLGYELREKDKN